jgi:hypothetical protein
VPAENIGHENWVNLLFSSAAAHPSLVVHTNQE